MVDPEECENARLTATRARDEPKSVDEADLADACAALAEEAVSAQTHLLSMKGLDGAPDWMGQEMAVWEIGEIARAYLLGQKTIRGRTVLLDRLAGMLDDPRFGKGRLNLAQIVGKFGKRQYVTELAKHLEDPDLTSQVLECLRRDRISGYEERVAALLEYDSSTLVRREAKKYLKAVATPG